MNKTENPYDQCPWVKKYDPGVPSQIQFPAALVHDFLDDAAGRFPNNTCISCNDIDLSYSEISRMSSRLAAFLTDAKLNKGDRVGIVLPNIPQFVIAFYGVLKAGGIVVAINPQYTLHEIINAIQDSGIEWLISLDADIERIKGSQHTHKIKWFISMDVPALNELGNLLNTEVSEGGINPEKRDISLITIIKNYSKDSFREASVTGDDPAIFQYSGGTTGIPKAAIGLHRNLVANTIQFRNWLIGMNEGKEVVLVAIPLYHVYGMVIAMSLGIALGSRLIFPTNPRDMDQLLTLIEKYRVTLFPGVPNIYAAFIAHSSTLSKKLKLDSVKACISGSAPLPSETKLQFESITGGKLLEGYGLSEAPTATHCNPMYGENKTGSIGLPLPDVKCRIVDPVDGIKLLPVGSSGELIIKGPQVMAGYHNQPKETQITLRNGWLYTGDIAYMDDDGYFYLVDRKKDMIKISGFQVWPREIEGVLIQNPKVHDAAVAGILGEDQFEVIKAWIVLKEGESITPEELSTWCGKLSGWVQNT